MSPVLRKEYRERIRERYKRANRSKKSSILDEFCAVTNYNRKYAIKLLAKSPKKKNKYSRPGPARIYTKEVISVIKVIWLNAEQICSKRLVAALPFWLPFYEQRYGVIADSVKKKVLAISPASIDRVLKPTRIKHKKKGLSGTKPGSLLKNHIPIRTDNWDVTKPGFLEADTVAHCGNSLEGDFVWSLTMTDIFSHWTENRAVWNKGSQGVQKAIEDVERALVFLILGFDCDNGSEFLNWHLWNYFVENRGQAPVQFTRSRPYHKNDNAHVEQKNYTHVRQLFGYDRFDNSELVPLMNGLYKNEWSAYQNYFLPTMKLVKKERINSKTKREHEKMAKTPYQRLCESNDVSAEAKAKLKANYSQLNPFLLKQSIEKKLKIIFNTLLVSSNMSQS